MGAQDGTDASYPRDSRLAIPKNAVADVIDVEGSAYGGFIWGIARQPSKAGALRCGWICIAARPCQAPSASPFIAPSAAPSAAPSQPNHVRG
jgi:hypothetical protein